MLLLLWLLSLLLLLLLPVIVVVVVFGTNSVTERINDAIDCDFDGGGGTVNHIRDSEVNHRTCKH